MIILIIVELFHEEQKQMYEQESVATPELV